MITKLLPQTAALNRRARLALTLGFGALAAGMATDCLHLIFGFGAGWGSAMRGPVPAGANVVAAAIMIGRAVVERERRPVWILLAAAISSYAIAFLLWGTWLEYKPHPPDPSIADGFWLAMYPLLCAAFVVAGRGYSPRRVSLKIWLDGVLAATAVAAIGTAFLIPPILHSAHRNHAAVTVNMVYPMADLVMGVVMVALIGIRGWQLDRKWLLAIAAFVFWLGADCAASVQIIRGAATGSSVTTLAYMAAFTAVAAAAWQPEDHPAGTVSGQWGTLVLPLACTLAAPTILIIDHFSRVPLGAFIITLLAMTAAIVRMGLALRDILTLHDIQRAALTDELTGLWNRRMFFTKLTSEIAAAERDGGTLTALLFDLDNFKQLNDTLGHDAGDDLLRLIGPRLADSVRGGDMFARLGGDEFAILLERGSEPQTAPETAEAVLSSLSEPFHVQDVTLRLTASVGIASYPQDADGAEALLKCVDVAMYEAKRSHRGWEVYTSERDHYTTERLELAHALAAALEKGELEAEYQPIVDTVSRRITSAEALVRWRLPDGTLRLPGEFLYAAEVAGLSRALTRRMLELALPEVKRWRTVDPSVCVTVNVTVADLLDESFPDEVHQALTTQRLTPDALVIEITETSIIADPNRVVTVLHRLETLGVKLALDDFGTGYSSLTHLRDLPVYAVKIDRSFISNMLEDGPDAAIVYATIELAHRLNLMVVAEGVEDERTWKELTSLSSDRIQGYAFSRPVASARVLALLEDGRAGHLAESQVVPTPASTASGGSIS